MVSPLGQRTVAVFAGGGTGGHLYPALALADALTGLRPDVDPFFVGSERGLEARVLPERGLDHHLLPVRGFRRGRILENLGVLWALVRSLVSTGLLFSHLRPSIVVVTGGYAGGPAGLVAAVMGIPMALQEQNARPGFTSRVLSRWARQIHLAFPEAKDAVPSGARARSLLSGNPVREVVFHEAGAAKARFGVEEGARMVLVVGGSQGARALNNALLEVVRRVSEGKLERPKDVSLLWATGPNDLERVEEQVQSLGDPDWVRVVGYIQEMPEALSAATLAITRAGAMTTSELLAWGVPAILVPLPTAAADHQTRNAESLAEAGMAVHLPEKDMTGDTLWGKVLSVLSSPATLASMAKAASSLGRPEASREIATALEALLPKALWGGGRGLQGVTT